MMGVGWSLRQPAAAEIFSVIEPTAQSALLDLSKKNQLEKTDSKSFGLQ